MTFDPLRRYRPLHAGRLVRAGSVRAHAFAIRPEMAMWARGWLQPARLTLPEFLIVGAQKSGTTWLWKNLRAHDGIFMPENPASNDPTEVRYFLGRPDRSLRHYARFFAPAEGRRAGEKCPLYCALPEDRIRYIRAVMPHTKLVFLLRNPVERSWSHAVMNLSRLPNVPLRDVPHDLIRRHIERKHPLGLYTEMIDRWQRHFPPEQIWVGFYDDIVDRPADLLTSVLRFLDVEVPADWSSFPVGERVNPNATTTMPWDIRSVLEASYRDEIAALADRYAGAASVWQRQLVAA